MSCHLIISSLIGYTFRNLGFDEANIITVYVLGVLITAVVTTHQIYSLISSVVSVLVFNFILLSLNLLFKPMIRISSNFSHNVFAAF